MPTAMRPISRQSPSGRYLARAFGIIVLLLILTSALAFYRERRVQAEVRSITENAMTSIVLVSQMESDLSRMQNHLNKLISNEDNRSAEQKLWESEADYSAAIGAYAPLATFPEEAQLWARFQAESIHLRARLGLAVELLRRDRSDANLKGVLASLEDEFARVGETLTRLESLNQREAEHAMQRVSFLQLRANIGMIVLALLAIGVTLFLGRRVTRVVESRDRMVAEHLTEVESRNRELDAFAGKVAHDLRGPLTTLNVTTSALISKVNGERGLTDVLRRSVIRMDRIIDDLLALSRVDTYSGGGACDPAAVAEQLREELGPRLADEQATIRLEMEHSSVRCSEGLFRQVLLNLLDNALKYQHPDRPVEVLVQSAEQDRIYVLTVEDNGIGMTSAEASQVFEAFYRAPRTRDMEGSGLGLAIVKRIVQASGGSISVESLVGKGSRFNFWIPLVDQPEQGIPAEWALPRPRRPTSHVGTGPLAE